MKVKKEWLEFVFSLLDTGYSVPRQQFPFITNIFTHDGNVNFETVFSFSLYTFELALEIYTFHCVCYILMKPINQLYKHLRYNALLPVPSLPRCPAPVLAYSIPNGLPRKRSLAHRSSSYPLPFSILCALFNFTTTHYFNMHVFSKNS